MKPNPNNNRGEKNVNKKRDTLRLELLEHEGNASHTLGNCVCVYCSSGKKKKKCTSNELKRKIEVEKI